MLVEEVPGSILARDGDVDDIEASTRRRNGEYDLVVDEVSRLASSLYLPLSIHSLQYRPMAPYDRVRVDSIRSLFPFFLIIAVVLLLVWRLVVSPGLRTPAKVCPEGTSPHWIRPGESCWELSRQHGWSLEKFKEANAKVVCDPLIPGTSVCLPPQVKGKEKTLGRRVK